METFDVQNCCAVREGTMYCNEEKRSKTNREPRQNLFSVTSSRICTFVSYTSDAHYNVLELKSDMLQFEKGQAPANHILLPFPFILPAETAVTLSQRGKEQLSSHLSVFVNKSDGIFLKN